MADSDQARSGALSEQFECLGVSRDRITVLNSVIREGVSSTADIAGRVGGSFNATWRLLVRLEGAGLVHRQHATHPRGVGRITYWRSDPDAVQEMVYRLEDALFHGAQRPA